MSNRSTPIKLALSALGLAAASTACTGEIAGAWRLQQQTQTFGAKVKVNTMIDLLWVVDNSSSMDISQEKLRAGFTAFAQKYLQPTWDVRIAVITTDTYLANPAFAPYLASQVPGTLGWKSPYINSRLSSFANPSYDATLVNLATGAFDHGVTIGDMIPVWGPSFGQLLPGLHDGPIPALCYEGMPYFLNGVTQCAIRDAAAAPTGPAHCLNPGSGESSLTECVNTVENNSIHTGTPILASMPPSGPPSGPPTGTDPAAWTSQMIDSFMINATTGSAGHGSERGLGSVLQLLQDNEFTSTAFFRPGALRGLIFVSDEDDQTLQIEDTPPPGFNPWTHYQCDEASLEAMNGGSTDGFCCASGCRYGDEGTSCAPKTVDGYTYTLSICPRQDLLAPVSSIKQQLDSFFTALDANLPPAPSGGDSVNVLASGPNYFVASIVALTGDSIQTLQATRNGDDAEVGALKSVAVDRADRYIDLGAAVGNNSLALDIASPDYSPVLDAIGQAILTAKSSFTLSRAPTGAEDMIVTLLHADGSSTVIPSSAFVINNKTLTLIDQSLVLSFQSTDQVSINYQPKTVY